VQILTDIEKQTAVWKKITEHLEERLADLRAQNDTSKSAGDTEKLRGRIAEVKHLLGLDSKGPETESNDVPSY